MDIDIDTKDIINSIDKNTDDSTVKDCNVSVNSFIDYDSLSNEELIYRYIMEKKNKGQFLPYEYHLAIQRWVNKVDSIDDLLLILDEIFSQKKTRSFSLVSLNKKVMEKLKRVSK